jgi:hypothetical protein
VAIDRGLLADRDSTVPAAKKTLAAAPAGASPVVITLPYRRTDPDAAPRPVPDVLGRSTREAALALHRRGFRVTLRGLGRVVRTVPAGGEVARGGSAVLVEAE